MHKMIHVITKIHFYTTVRLMGLLALTTVFTYCKKPVGPQCEGADCDDISALSYSDVVIGCEGNFGWGNASLSVYNPVSKNISNDVYQTVNSLPLGDVCQSMTDINGRLYVVVNNSGKIQVLDTATYANITTISGLTSPRFICKGLGNVAYVSDLYANQIAIVDLTSHTVTGSISVNNWTEEMLFKNNTLWVTCPDTNWIIRIDVTSQTPIDTLVMSKGVSSLVEDKNGFVWALSTGGIQQELAQLARFNGTTGQLIQSFVFNSLTDNPTNLRLDTSGEFIYFLNNGVYKMSTSATQLPQTPSIVQVTTAPYGLGIDPTSGDIYVADALDYVQSGNVYRYNASFELIDQFSVGIIPQSFWFK